MSLNIIRRIVTNGILLQTIPGAVNFRGKFNKISYYIKLRIYRLYETLEIKI